MRESAAARLQPIMSAWKPSIVALFLPLLLVAPGCGKSDEAKDSGGGEAGEAKPEVAAKDPATLFSGDKATLPPVFGELKLGMTREQAKAALPELPEDGNLEAAEYPQLWFKAEFDDKTGKLARVYFNLPKDKAVELMTAQWGEPKQATEYDKPVLWWFNPEAELRVSVSESFTDGEAHVEFTHYWPAAKFLGEGEPLAFEAAAPLLGLTVAELESNYAPYVNKRTAADAAKQQEDVKKLAGDEAGALMGKPEASVDLYFPPLEWGKFWTPVHPSWSDEGKLERMWFSLEFEPYPAAKDELFAALKAKWGEPKQEDEYGDTVYVFSEQPFIKVEEDTISKAWTVYVEPER